MEAPLGCRLVHVLSIIARTASGLHNPVRYGRDGEIPDDADNEESDVNPVWKYMIRKMNMPRCIHMIV